MYRPRVDFAQDSLKSLEQLLVLDENARIHVRVVLSDNVGDLLVQNVNRRPRGHRREAADQHVAEPGHHHHVLVGVLAGDVERLDLGELGVLLFNLFLIILGEVLLELVVVVGQNLAPVLVLLAVLVLH